VKLTANDGRVVKPVTYSGGSKAYTNAFGAKWRASSVDAEYPISGLAEGFSIDYAASGGLKWTFKVSRVDAARSLLLGLEPKK
jgi:hypothetical protein